MSQQRGEPSSISQQDQVRMLSRARRLPPAMALYLQAGIVATFLAGSSLPTPLYPVYQAEWHFSAITITVVFAIYAVAVLASLLTIGSLSDYVGRRPVLLIAITLQAFTMIIFAHADGVGELIAARVVQGVSTGGAVGAIGAGMLDIHREKGTIAGAIAPMIGTASGGLLSGLFVEFLPAPTTAVYLVLLGLLVLEGVGVLAMAETVGRRRGALASVRPQFGVPRLARRAMAVAVPATIATWALVGLFGSLGPNLINLLIGRHSLILGGVALFLMGASGAVAVLLMRSVGAEQLLITGLTALLAGVGATVVATVTSTGWLLFVALPIVGAGFGAGFQGSLRIVLPHAQPYERAGLLSALYVVCYLAMGVPAVIAGVLVVDGGGLLGTSTEYEIGVLVLAALALAGTLRLRDRQPVALRPEATSGS